MAAVWPACPPEFLADRSFFEAALRPQLQRATTEPLAHMMSSWLSSDNGNNGSPAWAISEKNSFLRVEVPEQPQLLRSRTDPLNAHTQEELSDSDTETSAKATAAAPPPLILESFVTDERYDLWPGACDTDVEPSCGLPAPPPLSLEYVETDDPFRAPPGLPLTPAAAERLGLFAPPPLSLEYVATDDPFSTTGYMAMDVSGFLSCDMEWPPGLPPPPPIALECFDTEDPFEKPLEPPQDFFLQGSEPAFVSLPVRPAMCGPPPPPIAPAPLIGTPMPMPPPPPPAQMPSMPAPENFEASSSHEAPVAQPGHTPGAGITALLETDLQRPGLLARPATAAGCTHVHWAVDARKLEGQDKQTVSQVFTVELPGYGATPFKLVLYPKATNDGKHGAGFKKAKGLGRVILKCEAQLPESCADVCFRIGAGRAGNGSASLQAFRGPVLESFFDHSCHGLPKTEEDWDFNASVDDSRTFLVTLEIAPTGAFKANPSIWWAPLAPPEVTPATTAAADEYSA